MHCVLVHVNKCHYTKVLQWIQHHLMDAVCITLQPSSPWQCVHYKMCRTCLSNLTVFKSYLFQLCIKCSSVSMQILPNAKKLKYIHLERHTLEKHLHNSWVISLLPSAGVSSIKPLRSSFSPTFLKCTQSFNPMKGTRVPEEERRENKCWNQREPWTKRTKREQRKWNTLITPFNHFKTCFCFLPKAKQKQKKENCTETTLQLVTQIACPLLK